MAASPLVLEWGPSFPGDPEAAQALRPATEQGKSPRHYDFSGPTLDYWANAIKNLKQTLPAKPLKGSEVAGPF